MASEGTGLQQDRLNYDSDFCGRVPLNQTNLVQPHGVLMILRRSDFQVLQCSENTQDFFAIPAQEFAGSLLAAHLAPDQEAHLRKRTDAGAEGKFPVQLRISGRDFLCVVELREDLVLLEAEPVAGQETFLDIYEQIRYVMAAIESSEGIIDACAITAAELKNFSGFDKVMIYRFDKDWNGEVIAEVLEPGMESYMGLLFPASDIPKQARDLYRKNPYRLIPNINYTPIKLHPVLNPLTSSFTDLTYSNLRSVAAVHLEYLKNMGVEASMSTRILKNGRLWGLIACHHRTPRYLSYQDCSVFELLSTFITSKISATEDAVQARRKADGHALIARIADSVYASGKLSEGLAGQQDALLELLAADGVALVQQRSVSTWGKTPTSPELQDLVYWLQTQGVSRLYQQSALGETYEAAGNFAGRASGLLALPMHPERGHYLLAFRQEAVRRIDWGGNPASAINFEDDGRRYHPRHSFQLWQQTVTGSAPEWTETEEQLAESFRQFLLEWALRQN